MGRTVLPRSLGKSLVRDLHYGKAMTSHQGVKRTIQAIRRSYFWPGVGIDVIDTVGDCNLCSKNKGV